MMDSRHFLAPCVALLLFFAWAEVPVRPSDLRVLAGLGQPAKTASYSIFANNLLSAAGALAYSRVPKAYMFPVAVGNVVSMVLAYLAQAATTALDSLAAFFAAKCVLGLAGGLRPLLKAALRDSSRDEAAAKAKIHGFDVASGVVNGPASLLAGATFAVGGVNAPYYAAALGVALTMPFFCCSWPRGPPLKADEGSPQLPGAPRGSRPATDWKLYLTFIGASTFWAPTFVAGVVSVLRAFSQASTSDAAACEGGEVWSSMVAAAAGIFGVLGAAFHKFMLQQRLGDTATCLVGAAVAAPASTLLGFTQHAWQTFLGGCVHGIGLGMAASFSPISTAYCQRAHPDSFAAAIAFFDAGQLVGLTAGPLLVGLSLGTGTACELEPYRLQALSTGSGICYLLFMATCIVLSAASAEAPRAPEVPLPGGVPQQPPQEGPQAADAASIGDPTIATDPADVHVEVY